MQTEKLMADTVASEVIECATRVAQELGYGHSESVYHQAMLVELRMRNVPYESEKVLSINYRGLCVGYARVDLLVKGCVVLELKAVQALRAQDKAQLGRYTQLLNMPRGLLINFGACSMNVWNHTDAL
jgi:GxxExxY protein